MSSIHPGSPEFNNEQLKYINKIIWFVYYLDSDKFKDSPLIILKNLGYDFIMMEIISKFNEDFDCRTDENITLYYNSVCSVPTIKYPKILNYLNKYHMSPSGKAAYFNDIRALKLFNNNHTDAILMASYNNSLECLKMIKKIWE